MMLDIQPGLDAYLEGKRKLYPQHVNRVSSLDDPCLRRLYYRRAAWDKAAPHPTSLLGVFETGTVLEPVIERIVSEVGMASNPPWRIVGSQMPTNDAFLQKYEISGSIDGFLQIYTSGVNDITTLSWKTLGVVDIKTMSGNIYPRLNTYEDLAFYPWTRAYRGQLMTYAFAHNLEDCFILAVNKQNLYEMKLIHFPIDMAYLEGLLQKAATVNAAIEAGEPPDGANDHSACDRCQWLSYCLPDLEPTPGLKFVDNAELEDVLDRMAELEGEMEDYKRLEKRRDEMLTKGQDMSIGRWLITWKQSRNGAWRKTITTVEGVTE